MLQILVALKDAVTSSTSWWGALAAFCRACSARCARPCGISLESEEHLLHVVAHLLHGAFYPFPGGKIPLMKTAAAAVRLRPVEGYNPDAAGRACSCVDRNSKIQWVVGFLLLFVKGLALLLVAPSKAVLLSLADSAGATLLCS